ncbi:MAG: hypothetical protein V1776_03880 [Candidatus Diapherotrites archaeon]
MFLRKKIIERDECHGAAYSLDKKSSMMNEFRAGGNKEDEQ